MFTQAKVRWPRIRKLIPGPLTEIMARATWEKKMCQVLHDVWKLFP